MPYGIHRVDRLLALSAALWCGPLSGQTVSGRVHAEAGPAAGAWLTLVDSVGQERTAALSSPEGLYRIRAPFPGTYRVRIALLGHGEIESEPLVLGAATAATFEATLSPRPLELGALVAEAERRCRSRGDADLLVARLWSQVRQALSAVRWSAQTGMVSYSAREWERDLDLANRTVLRSEERTIAGRGDRPFATPPADSLARFGFVQGVGVTATFYAPDADVLLSDAFAETHCFRYREGDRDRVGLAFEPQGGRRVPDVTGTLWLDAETGALRSLEFRYTGIDYGPGTRDLGGELRFERLPSGVWITREWRIRGPLLSRSRAGGRHRMIGFHERGAIVVRIGEVPRISLRQTAQRVRTTQT